jgi:hypothetical protein
VVWVSLGKSSGRVGVEEGRKTEKGCEDLAAFSASPGKLNPCAKDCDYDCTLLEPSLTAPFLNLSSTDIV